MCRLNSIVVWMGALAGGLNGPDVYAQDELPNPPKPVAGELPAPPKPAINILPARPASPVPERASVQVLPQAVFIEKLPDVLPPPTLTSDFGIPEGLKTAPEILLPSLGYGAAHCFPLTPTTCFEAAYKCYTYGLYQDALAFTKHGLQQSNHARLYLLKAMCEMHLARCEDARVTLVKYRHASLRLQESVGLTVARERLNDPMRVRLELLLAAWDE